MKSWLKEHVQIFKYCLQISKCTNDECCKPLRTNANDAFHNRFLPTPIALNLDPFLVDTVDKSEKCKIVDLYPLWPIAYTWCHAVQYDLYCPSVAISNPHYLCILIILTSKELLKLHLKSTQHHAYVDEVADDYGAPFRKKLKTFIHTNFNFCTTSKYFSCDTKIFLIYATFIYIQHELICQHLFFFCTIVNKFS